MNTRKKDDKRLGFLWIPLTFGALLVGYQLARIAYYLAS